MQNSNLLIASTMNFKDINSLFSGAYLPAALTRCTFLSAFAKLLFAHLAQNSDSHNLVQIHFLFTVSELGFLDEREVIETLDELESFGMILVQRGNSNAELVVVRLMPNFTEILASREANARRKKRARHSATFDFKQLPFANEDRLKKPTSRGVIHQQSRMEKTADETAKSVQCDLFAPITDESQPLTNRRKAGRKEPRSRHSLQDCWNFAQYQRELNGAEKIPTPDRFAVALYTTGQQDDEIDLFLLSREQYHQPASENITAVN